jgi:hypothetical protein
MSINAREPFFGNDAGKPAIVFGVSGFRQRQDFRWCVGDEEFCPRNADALAAVAAIRLGSMGLEPNPIALKPLAPRPRLVQFAGVGNFLHNHGRLFRHHDDISWKGTSPTILFYLSRPNDASNLNIETSAPPVVVFFPPARFMAKPHPGVDDCAARGSEY